METRPDNFTMSCLHTACHVYGILSLWDGTSCDFKIILVLYERFRDRSFESSRAPGYLRYARAIYITSRPMKPTLIIQSAQY